MCGFAAVLGRHQQAPQRAKQMARALRHRGPDDSGLATTSDASGAACGVLAHQRLAILDLSACGHQPMVTADGRYAIVFNGEIYNFRALRAELERAGARFRGESDTEVLLEGWAREGARFLARLRGMYAFVVWDRDRAAASLVRDPFGIKPLYVAERDGCVVAASELRAVLASELVEPRLDRAALAGYLADGSVPEPLTAVRGVRALEPGTVVEVAVRDGRASGGRGVRFADTFGWSAGEPRPALVRAPAEAYRTVRDALRDSVAHHLVSDVPVALFLSGGIDSSAVVALAAEVSPEPLDAFTVVFEEREFDESGPATAVARKFGVRHHLVALSGADLLASLPFALRSMDQPSLDGLNTFVVSGAVRRAGLKVVLSGLGGDELFAGYASFRRACRLAPVFGPLRVAGGAAANIAGLAGGTRAQKIALMLDEPTPAAAAYRASRALFGRSSVRALLGGAEGASSPSGRPMPPADLTLLQQVSWLELSGYMRNTLLRDSDVLSMAHGLELRVPFVDREVAAASLRVPDALKLDRTISKPALVRALDDLLPREVWDRPKQGFTLPFARWMHDELRGEVASALEPRRLERVGIDGAAAAAVWREFLAGSRDMTWSRPWALYTLVRWAEEVGVAVDDAPPASEPRGFGVAAAL